MTAFTFCILWFLQDNQIIDPSVTGSAAVSTVVANYSDTSLPLKEVRGTPLAAIGLLEPPMSPRRSDL